MGCLHSCFDLLGIVSPLLLSAKLFLKIIKNFSWDEQLPPSYLNKWKLICKDFQSGCRGISFDGQVARNDDNLPAKIYIICDSSKEAYGSAMYLLQGSKSS